MADGGSVEVAYARADRQVVLTVEGGVGTTVEEAIRRSRILEQFPEIDLAVNRVGVFGKLVRLDRRLNAGDRVEIYRPLIGDPKEIRRQLAAEGKTMGKR